MRQVREVLRLKGAGVAINELARRVGVASSTVRLTLSVSPPSGSAGRCRPRITDAMLEAQLFTAVGKKQGHRRRPEPDCAAVHRSRNLIYCAGFIEKIGSRKAVVLLEL
jgi:transposase